MPRRVLKFTMVRFLRRVMARYAEDQSSVLSGYIAYAAMLSAFPFMIFATAVAGLIGQHYSTEAIKLLFEVAPEHVAQTLQPVLQEVIGQNKGGILTLSALGAIYGASNGVEAVRIGLDRAYDVDRPRNFVMNRLWSIGFVFLGFIVFGALAVLIILAPLAWQLLQLSADLIQLPEFLDVGALAAEAGLPTGVNLVRYLVGAGLLYWFFWLMHYNLPGRDMRGFRLAPGILTSMVIWVLLASALSVYLAYSPSYTLTYGALAGVVVTLLFFYLTGVAIIFGAQINAVIQFDLPFTEEEAQEEEAP